MTASALMDLGTVLGVWVTPTTRIWPPVCVAHAVDQGSRVVDVTATRGKGGSLDEERWPPETMGEVRERELRRCLAILGVTEHYWLELPDIDMRSPLPRVGAPRVRALMDKVQPDTVLTFGPDGMTGHVGHKSVNRWVTDAFREVAPPGARLFYATQTPELQPNGCRSLSPSTCSFPARRRSHRVRSSASATP
jgi:LmbE family N-acetylglucosaminyl deacetylase